jgi:hypothetical protein
MPSCRIQRKQSRPEKRYKEADGTAEPNREMKKRGGRRK